MVSPQSISKVNQSHHPKFYFGDEDKCLDDPTILVFILKAKSQSWRDSLRNPLFQKFSVSFISFAFQTIKFCPSHFYPWICMCVCTRVQVCAFTMAQKWRAERNLWCWSSPSIMFETHYLPVATVYARLTRFQAFSCLSFHLTMGAMHLVLSVIPGIQI